MRGGWWVITCGLAVLALGACAGTPATITKYDTRRMPPGIVISRVLDQVADLLAVAPRTAAPALQDDGMSDVDKRRAAADIAAVVASRLGTDLGGPPPQQPLRATLDQLAPLVTIWPDPYITPHPHTPLHEIEFETRSHATATAGLCAVDFVVVHFAYAGANRGPATRVQASHVDVSHYYYLVAPPAAPVLPKADPSMRAQTDRLCAAIKRDYATFFEAPDEVVAVRGAWLARTVIAQAAAGNPRFGLVCDEERREGSNDCARALHDVQPKFLQIRECPDGGMPCSFLFMSGGISFAVTMDTATPPKTVHITRDAEVVFADPLAD